MNPARIRIALESLPWRKFDTYPEQQSSVYIYIYTDDRTIRRFYKIDSFNAVSFLPKGLLKITECDGDWNYCWLPAELVEQKINTIQETIPEE